MKAMSILLAAAGLAAALASGTAAAQAASDEVKRECRSVANQIARMIEDLKRRGVKDLERGLSKPSTNWGEQVASYMILASSRSDSLSESELASLGYSYCVERRPRN
jgi:hypothetical protein